MYWCNIAPQFELQHQVPLFAEMKKEDNREVSASGSIIYDLDKSNTAPATVIGEIRSTTAIALIKCRGKGMGQVS